MIQCFNDKFFPVIIIQYDVQGKFNVFTLVNILKESCYFIVVSINWLKQVVKAWDDFQIDIFKFFVKFNKSNGVLYFFVVAFLLFDIVEVKKDFKIFLLFTVAKIRFFFVKNFAGSSTVFYLLTFRIWKLYEDESIRDVVWKS